MVRLLNGFYKFQTSGLDIKGVQDLLRCTRVGENKTCFDLETDCFKQEYTKFMSTEICLNRSSCSVVSPFNQLKVILRLSKLASLRLHSPRPDGRSVEVF